MIFFYILFKEITYSIKMSKQKIQIHNVSWYSHKSTKLGKDYEKLMLKIIREMHRNNYKYNLKIHLTDMGKILEYKNLTLFETCRILTEIKKC